MFPFKPDHAVRPHRSSLGLGWGRCNKLSPVVTHDLPRTHNGGGPRLVVPPPTRLAAQQLSYLTRPYVRLLQRRERHADTRHPKTASQEAKLVRKFVKSWVTSGVQIKHLMYLWSSDHDP